MKCLFVVLFLLLCSCGSKKEFIQLDSVENLRIIEQLHVDLYRDSKLLELLDIKIRQVETKDSSGNICVETNVDISKKTNRKDLDSTKLTVNKQTEGDKTINQNSGKERSGIMDDWVCIVTLIAFIIVALVVGILISKFKKSE